MGEAVMEHNVFKDLSEQDALRFMSRDEHLRRSRVVLAGMVGGAASVLDVGCGKAHGVSDLFSREQYFGVDISRTLIALAREGNPGYRFGVADGEALPMGDKTYEVALARSVLEHVPTEESAVRIFGELLRVADRVLVSWHTPPTSARTRRTQVQAELSEPIWQNRWNVEGFLRLAQRIKQVRVDEAVIWEVFSCLQ
jgi:SAM-dependent methyltransferase